MTQKLFVGGVAWATTEDGLKAHFSQAGNVKEVKIIYDRDTNRSRGFAFVEMETAEEAENAIKMLDGKELDGRALKISEAREQVKRD